MADSKDYSAQWAGEAVNGWENIYEFMSGCIYEKALRPSLPVRRGTALELGCGDGMNTRKIAKDFEETTVVDFSEDFLREARNNSCPDTNVRYVRSTFLEYEPDEQVDAIFMMHILEHVEDPVAVLRKYRHYLQPHGRIFISVPNAHSLHRQLGVAMGLLQGEASLNAQDAILGHFRVYDPTLLWRHLRDAGLKYGPLIGSYLKPLSGRQMNDWDLDILNGLEKLGKTHPALSADLCIVATR